MLTVIVGAGAQLPFVLSHTASVIGRDADPVSALTVKVSAAPMLVVATANAPVPLAPGMSRIPSLVGDKARAITSGVGVCDADSKSVSIPEMLAAGPVLLHWNAKLTSVGPNEACGVSAIT